MVKRTSIRKGYVCLGVRQRVQKHSGAINLKGQTEIILHQPERQS